MGLSRKVLFRLHRGRATGMGCAPVAEGAAYLPQASPNLSRHPPGACSACTSLVARATVRAASVIGVRYFLGRRQDHRITLNSPVPRPGPVMAWKILSGANSPAESHKVIFITTFQ